MKRRTNIFFKALILLFICFCMITIVQLQIQFNELNDRRSALREEINNCKDNIDEMEEQLAQPFDEDYIIRVAREQLNYHMPEEIIYFNDIN